MEITAYHSSNEEELLPRRLLHVGTLDQARMRGGKHLHQIVLQPGIRIPRLRDHGYWNPRTLLRHSRQAKIAVYLNRHEGIPLHEFEEARKRCDIDKLPDSRFRIEIPSASDSWIVIDQTAIVSIQRIAWP